MKKRISEKQQGINWSIQDAHLEAITICCVDSDWLNLDEIGDQFFAMKMGWTE